MTTQQTLVRLTLIFGTDTVKDIIFSIAKEGFETKHSLGSFIDEYATDFYSDSAMLISAFKHRYPDTYNILFPLVTPENVLSVLHLAGIKE